MHPRLFAYRLRSWLEPCPQNLQKSWPIFKQMRAACGRDQLIAIKKEANPCYEVCRIFSIFFESILYENPLEIISILFGPWAKRCAHQKFFLVNATVNGISASIALLVHGSQLSSLNCKAAMVHFMIFMDSISKSFSYIYLDVDEIFRPTYISQLQARCIKYSVWILRSIHSPHKCCVFPFVCFHSICIKFSYSHLPR